LPTDYGNSVAIAISLIMGVTCANMVHAGYWQRIWAAESNVAVQRATVLAGILSAIVMVLVGITGYIAYSQFAILIVPGGGTAGDLSFLSVPWLIVTFMDEGWAVVTLIFGISMIASTCDTLQSGMTALLWPIANTLVPTATDKCKLCLIVVLMILLNVPPVLLALSGQSILQLFLLADLLAAGVVAPLFLGFWKRTHPMGALAGAIGGLGTTIVVYAVGEQYDEGFDSLVSQGGIFRRVATYAFVLTPVVSAIITVLVSLLIPGYEFEGYPKAAEEPEKTNGVQLTTTADSKDQEEGERGFA
jgi:Na+/proline symporter